MLAEKYVVDTFKKPPSIITGGFFLMWSYYYYYVLLSLDLFLRKKMGLYLLHKAIIVYTSIVVLNRRLLPPYLLRGRNDNRDPLIIINSSLPRRREFSDVKGFWIPAFFAEMTFLEVA